MYLLLKELVSDYYIYLHLNVFYGKVEYVSSLHQHFTHANSTWSMQTEKLNMEIIPCRFPLEIKLRARKRHVNTCFPLCIELYTLLTTSYIST